MTDAVPRRVLLLAAAAAGTAVVAAFVWRRLLRAAWTRGSKDTELPAEKVVEVVCPQHDIAESRAPLPNSPHPSYTDAQHMECKVLTNTSENLNNGEEAQSCIVLTSEPNCGFLAPSECIDPAAYAAECGHQELGLLDAAIKISSDSVSIEPSSLPTTTDIDAIGSLELDDQSLSGKFAHEDAVVDAQPTNELHPIMEHKPAAMPAEPTAEHNIDAACDSTIHAEESQCRGQIDVDASILCDTVEDTSTPAGMAAPTTSPVAAQSDIQTPAVDTADGVSADVDASEAALFRTRGNKYYNAGRFEDALRCYVFASEKYPLGHEDRALAFSNKAAALLSLERYADAVDACNAALAASPRMVKALDRRSRALEHLGALEEALADALAATIIDAQKTPSLVEHADELVKAISESKASETYASRKFSMPPPFVCRRFLESFPREWRNVAASSCDLKSPLAAFYSALVSGSFDDAASLIANAFSSQELTESCAPEILNWSGTMHLLCGNFEKAIDELQHCADLLPDDATPRIKLALAAMEMGNESDMTAWIEAAITVDETDAAAFYHHGEIMALSGDMQAAVVDFKRAIQLDAEFCTVYAHQARALQALGNTQDAETVLNNAFELFPDNVEIMLALGECLAIKSQKDEALYMIDAAIVAEPDNPHAHLTRAFVAAEHAQSDDTLGTMLADVAARFPYFGTVQLQLAAYLAARGKVDEAILHYAAACEHSRSLHDISAILAHRTLALAQADVAKRYPDIVNVQGTLTNANSAQ